MANLDAQKDDFTTAGTPDSANWPTIYAVGTAVNAGGVLTVTTAAGATNSSGVASSTLVPNSAYLMAQVTHPGTPASHRTTMGFYRNSSGRNADNVSMYVSGGVLFRSVVNSSVETAVSMGTYDPVAHSWWMIRYTAGTTTDFAFHTSADGITWSDGSATVMTATLTFSTVNIFLEAKKSVGANATATSTFDNVNLGVPIPVPPGVAVAIAMTAPTFSFVAGSDTASPDGINDLDALDSPTVTEADDAAPDGINDATVSDDPTVTEVDAASPDGIGDAIALDNPAVVPNDTEADPDGVNDPIATDDPTVTFGDLALPDEGPQLDIVSDNPTVTETDAAAPDGIGDAIATDNPTGVYTQAAQPDDAGDLAVALDDPTAVNTQIATPDGVAVATASDNPTGAYSQPATLDDGVTIAVAADNPTVLRLATPDGVAVAVASDNPTGAFAAAATLTAGVAVPVAQDNPSTSALAAPAGVAVPIGQDPPTPTASGAPADGVAVAVALDNPTITLQFRATPDGLFVHQHTQAPESVTYPDPVLVPSPIYTRLVPRTPPSADLTPVQAAHFLGIGPWYVEAIWGSINHGIRPRARGVSTPLLPLPTSVSKSFTLRLNAGDEARTDFELPREQAFLVERMATDLWWRRRDPHRGVLEPIGRFNAQTVDISMSEQGKVKISCTWIDHRSLLEDRLILNYLDVVHQETQWAAATLCTDILQFVIPANSQLDLTEIFDAPAAIGTTRWAFEALPGATVADVMDNLSAASSVKFEWYVEMPTVDSDRPKLRLIPGTRGADKGVILHEIGVGESPIASWAIQAAGEKYANAVMYSDSSAGAAVEIMPVDVKKYGEHDAHVTDSSLKGGVLAAIKDAAARKVAELSSQQITWTLKLRAGYWEGRDHIDVGDWVTVRITLGGEIITGVSRVTEINVDIDELGVEDVSLTLGPPRPAKDPRSRYASQARFVRALKASTSKGTPPPEIHTM